jgi:hypothetical protein
MRAGLLLTIVALELLNPMRAQAQADVATTLVERNYLVDEWIVPQNPPADGLWFQIRETPERVFTVAEKELMKKIRDEVAPQSWDSAGGRGKMTYLPEQQILCVHQSETVHAQMSDYFKAVIGYDIAVAVRIASFSRGRMEANQRLHWTEDGGVKFSVLSEVELYRMLESAQGDMRTHIMQAPTMKLADGREGTVKVGEWVELDSQGKFIVTKANAVGARAVEKVFCGVEGRFLPKLANDRKQIAIEAELVTRNVKGDIATRTQRGLANDQGATSPIMEFKVAAAALLPDRHTVALWMGTVKDEVVEEAPKTWWQKLTFNRGGTNRKEPNEQVLVLLITPQIATAPRSFRVQPLPNGVQATAPSREPQIISRISR